jgi:hypothetical protein
MDKCYPSVQAGQSGKSSISRPPKATSANVDCGVVWANGLPHREFQAGFTTVVAVDFGPDGLLYALELSDAAGFPGLGQGKVVRVRHSGEIEDVVTGLNVPGAMTFGPDDRL